MDTMIVTSPQTLFLKPSFAVAISKSGELLVHVEAERSGEAQGPQVPPAKPSPRN